MRRLGRALLLLSPALSPLLCAAAEPQPAYEIRQMEHTGWGPREGAPSDVRSLALAPDGSLTIAAGTGLFRFDGVRFTRLDARSLRQAAVPAVEASAQAFDRFGAVWKARAGGGIERLGPEATGQPRPGDVYTTVEGLTSNDARALLADREGDFWVGTAAGLDRFAPPVLAPFVDAPVEGALGLAACGDGTIWMGGGGQLTGVRRDGSLERHAVEGLRRIFFCDAQGGLWFAAARGLERLHGGSPEPYATPPGAGAVQAVGQDGAGRVYASVTGPPGLLRLGRGWEPVQAAGLPPGSPGALLGDHAGQLWAAYPDSIARLSVDGRRAEVYPVVPRGSLGRLTVLYESSLGMVAAGEQGLAWIRRDRFVRLRQYVALAEEGITGITEPPGRNLWLNTAHGIYEVPQGEIPSALVLRGPHPMFSRRVGPALPASTAAPSALRRPGTGELWFASGAGVRAALRPDADRPGTLVRPTLVAAEDNGRSLPLGGQVVLGPGLHTLRFRWQAVSLGDPGGVVYAWQLGAGKPHFAGHATEAVLSGLSPGRYRFRLGAAHGNSEWTEANSPFVFTIEESWWQQLLPVALLALGAALLGGVLMWRLGRRAGLGVG